MQTPKSSSLLHSTTSFSPLYRVVRELKVEHVLAASTKDRASSQRLIGLMNICTKYSSTNINFYKFLFDHLQVRLIRKNSSTTFFVKKESRLRLFNHEIRTQIPFYVCTKIVVQLQMSGARLSQMQKSTFWKKEKISSLIMLKNFC